MAEPALTQRRRPFDDQSNDDLDLYALVHRLWRYRVFIVGVTLGCALLGLAMGLSTRRTYEAEVALAVTAPKIDVQSSGPVQAVARGTTADFRPFIENSATAARVIQEFKLNAPPYNLSSTSFFTDVVSIEEIRNSTIMVLKARLADPLMAMNVVNRVAALASESTYRMSRQEADNAQNDLKAQLTDSTTRLEAAERAYRDFREASQIELLRKDIDALLDERGKLLTLLVNVETERSRLAKAEGELALRKRIDTMTRSVASDQELVEDSIPKPANPNQVMTYQIKTEAVNSVYQTIDEQVAETRTNLAALEQEKAQLVNVHKLNGGQLQQLTDLYKKESELSRLEMERDLARRVYLDVANSYETARLRVAGRSPGLQVIAPALAPDRPVSRRVAVKTLIALSVGLLLSTLGVLLYDAFAAGGPTPNVAVRSR